MLGFLSAIMQLRPNIYILVLIYSLLMMTLFTFFQDFVLGPFVRPGDAGQLETMRIARIMLYFLSAYLLFDGANIVFSNVLRGAGDTRFTMWVLAVVGIGCFGVPCVVLFLCGAAWWSLWSMLCLEILLLCVIYVWRYHQGKWTTMKVIEN